MSVFYPEFRFRRIYELTPEWLQQHHISVLLLDVDNTLTDHDNPDLSDEVRDWLKKTQDAGIKLLLLSNNKHERVQPFADKVGLGCIAHAAKPLTGGVKRAQQRLNATKDRIAIVGDQIFTDVLCANLAGVTSILVEPILPEKFWFFKLKRKLEHLLLKRYGYH